MALNACLNKRQFGSVYLNHKLLLLLSVAKSVVF